MNLLKIARIPTVTVDGSASVQESLDEMVNKGVDAIVVVEEGIAVGMFTASDLARRVSYKRLPMDRTEVKDVMTSPLHYAAPNTPCRDALSILSSKKIRHLPILDEGGHVLGMLSSRHLLRCICEEMSHELNSLTAYIAADGVGG